MSTYLLQLAARRAPGALHFHRRGGRSRVPAQREPSGDFAVQLAHAGRRRQPPAQIIGEEERGGPAPTPPTSPRTGTTRAAWRKAFMQAIRTLRQRHPQVDQSVIGWVAKRVGDALTVNPNMPQAEVEALIDSLVQKAPTE